MGQDFGFLCSVHLGLEREGWRVRGLCGVQSRCSYSLLGSWQHKVEAED